MTILQHHLQTSLTLEQLKELETLAQKVNQLSQSGQYQETFRPIEKILSLQPRNDSALQMMAESYLHTGQQEKAFDTANKALTINPQNFLCHRLLGMVYETRDDLDKATEHYITALNINKQMPLVHRNLAKIYFKKQDWTRGISYLANAVLLSPQNLSFKQLAVSHFGSFQMSGFEPRIKQTIQICLEEDNLTHRFLEKNWSILIDHDPDLKIYQTIPEDEDFDTFFKNQDVDTLAKTLNDPFFINGLSRFYITSIRHEKILTHIRKFILLNLDNTEFSIKSFYPKILPFIKSLAIHCWLNEYVFYQTTEETQRASDLKNSVETEFLNTPEDLLNLIILGCYTPLHSLSNAEDILKTLSLEEDKMLNDLVTSQISEPLEEQKIKKTIPVHGTIDNEISQDVQEQYEINPYPRWKTIHTTTSTVINPREIDILIAGCGTGQQPASMLPVYPNAKFSCVDLSRSSLAYAIRQCKKLNTLDRLEFKQADILQLGSLDKKFQVIYCSGVLHHMEDPEAGLKVLKDLLNEDGTMYISLYSEAARPHIVATRHFIAENNYGSTADDIRKVRQLIIEHSDELIRSCTTASDFFTLSQCRDLIFHVQEHRFTIPKIQDMLERHDLQFGGFFNFAQHELNRFTDRFPEENAQNDLEKWQQFEREDPEFLRNRMYNFYVRHKT